MSEKHSIFPFADRCTFVRCVPRKIDVFLASTMHRTNSIDLPTRDNNKPEIIVYYNRTKGGADVVNQKRKQYFVKRVCNKWPFAISFYYDGHISYQPDHLSYEQ